MLLDCYHSDKDNAVPSQTINKQLNIEFLVRGYSNIKQHELMSGFLHLLDAMGSFLKVQYFSMCCSRDCANAAVLCSCSDMLSVSLPATVLWS